MRSRLTAKPGIWWADKHFSGERSTWSITLKQLGCLFLLPGFLLLSVRDLLDPTFALIYEHPKGTAATQAAVVEAASWTSASPQFALILHSKWSSKLYYSKAMLLHQEQIEE